MIRGTSPGRFGAPALLLSLLLLPAPAAAQTVSVDRVLVRAVETPSRPDLQADEVQRAVARGEWTPPDGPGPDADGAEWRELTANEGGWIENDGLAAGVAYATVTVDGDGPWILDAMGYSGVLVNGEPRTGNVYGYKDEYQSWEPHFDFARVPVFLHRGTNTFLFHGNRYGIMRARLQRAVAPLLLNARDATLPDLVAGEAFDTFGALVVMNASGDYVTDATLRVTAPGGSAIDVDVPVVPPYGVRKAGFPVRGAAEAGTDETTLRVELRRGGKSFDVATLPLAVKERHDNRRVTFVSDIDGSVQYYGFQPAADDGGGKALILSLHGASVEAINQSGSYAAKPWAHLLAPTNRRPFGFNWEGWGRLDALEVLALGMAREDVDPDRVVLTGHSMGGHGSWHIGTLHPDRFAAIAPSAGWISLWSYRMEEPESAGPIGNMVDRAMLPSRTRRMAPNLADLGIYVLHGADDDNVPAAQAHLMLETLQGFHRDFTYHEEPGVGHWWDKSDEPGADCVDWAPMFDFLARRRRPAPDEVRHVTFRTPNPRVSAWSRWAGIVRQAEPFVMSELDVRLDPLARRLRGSTVNAEALGFDLAAAGMTGGASRGDADSVDAIHVELDGGSVDVPWPADGRLWLERDETWRAGTAPDPVRKGPDRAGPFR
ncbi:prolyl oligopeptidase family serine peptidase, partial [bacterium]|nr:prolyl oligopeptidase family serine peptidase [bacterium]